MTELNTTISDLLLPRAKEFKDVTMVLRLANSNESNMANLGDNMKLYLNRAVVPDEESEEEGATKVVGEIPISASIDAGVCEWRDVVVRNITIPEGKNVLTFDTMSEKGSRYRLHRLLRRNALHFVGCRASRSYRRA